MVMLHKCYLLPVTRARVKLSPKQPEVCSVMVSAAGGGLVQASVGATYVDCVRVFQIFI